MHKLALALVTGVLFVTGSAMAAGGGTTSTATVHLTGSQEPKGSPTGSGVFRFQLALKRDLLCFSLTWSNIDTPTAAHIHEAPKGQEGNIVVVLFGSPPVGHSGCRQVPTSLLISIGQHPSEYYVNVHTAKYPSGAIRAQL
jgi:CHRD domain